MGNKRNVEIIKALSSFMALHTTGCEEDYESREANRLDPETLSDLLAECRELVATEDRKRDLDNAIIQTVNAVYERWTDIRKIQAENPYYDPSWTFDALPKEKEPDLTPSAILDRMNTREIFGEILLDESGNFSPWQKRARQSAISSIRRACKRLVEEGRLTSSTSMYRGKEARCFSPEGY